VTQPARENKYSATTTFEDAKLFSPEQVSVKQNSAQQVVAVMLVSAGELWQARQRHLVEDRRILKQIRLMWDLGKNFF